MLLPDFIFPIFVLIGLVIIILIWQVLVLRRKVDFFLNKGDLNVENALKDLVKGFKDQGAEIEEILGRVSLLESIAKISIQKVGVMRYSPFKTIGGDQSFSLALLDKNDNGLILTSLYLKGEHRAFVKPIKEGKSEYSLSEEELKAIEQAKQMENEKVKMKNDR